MRPQLWLVHLWAAPEPLARLARLLSDDERARAARFVFDRLRPPFIVAHAALRVLAARHLGAHPARLRWDKGAYGKPRLQDASLELNLSHSGEWGLIAVGHEHAVGVDIEAVVPNRVSASMVDTVTSVAERAAFDAMERRDWPAAFFRLWVRKEAVIKAMGTGLTRPLDTIDVPLGPEAAPDGLVLRPPPEPLMSWWLWDVAAPTGYQAALVVRQPRGAAPLAPEPVRMLSLDEIERWRDPLRG